MNSGSQWKAWGPRLVSATLDCGEHLHVLSCYAPTSILLQKEKTRIIFFQSSSRYYFFNESYVL